MPTPWNLKDLFTPWQFGAVLSALAIQLLAAGYLAVGFALELFAASEESIFQVLTLLGITLLGLVWLVLTIINFARRKRAARASAMFWQLLFVAIGIGATGGADPNLAVVFVLIGPAAVAFFVLIGRVVASEFEGTD